jgi:hypothetical protein
MDQPRFPENGADDIAKRMTSGGRRSEDRKENR